MQSSTQVALSSKIKLFQSLNDFCSGRQGLACRLEYHINQPIYYAMRIPKKRGGERIIHAPNEELKAIQKSLNVFLQRLYNLYRPNAVHGFVKRNKGGESRGIISNAKEHVGQAYLLNMDLADFFPNISTKQIKACLCDSPVGMPENLATLIALLCTYEKKLPIGAPTSPVLANMQCYQMDLALMAFCESKNIRYSRYADDLSFSANKLFDKVSIQELQQLIQSFGFNINHKKTRQQYHTSKQVVTGLVVNEKVNVDRRYRKRLRAVLYSCKTQGPFIALAKHKKHLNGKSMDEKQFMSHLIGQVNFVRGVRGEGTPSI